MKLPCLSIAAACLCMIALGQKADPKDVKFLASPFDKDQVIGSLKWSIVDTKTGKILTRGNRKLHLGDVLITQHIGPDGHADYDKYISLGNHFVLCRPETFDVSPSGKGGFGLTVDRTDIDTFCWEWFNLDSPTHASKLQEGGEVGILISKGFRGYELRRISFLTPISMRTEDTRTESGGVAAWRTEIGKGSVINWPTVRNGKVVLP